MTEDKAAKLILSRAVDECNNNKSRSDYQGLPPIYKPIAYQVTFPHLLPIVCLVAFIVGVSTNYLSPSGKIHVIYNPILLLVLWNVFIYLLFIYRFFHSTSLPKIKSVKQWTRLFSQHQESRFDSQPETSSESEMPRELGFFERRIINVFQWGWGKIKSRSKKEFHNLKDKTKPIVSYAEVFEKFWQQWRQIAQPLMNRRLERLLHCGSIALTFGAIFGVYVRGLFTEYNVIWTSTFIRNETVVSLLINIIWGPAMLLSALLGQNITAADLNIKGLVNPSGVLAAPWIHLFVITAIAFIILPRCLLAIWDSMIIKFYKFPDQLLGLATDSIPQEEETDKRVFKINSYIGELIDYFKLTAEEQRLYFSLEYYLARTDEENTHNYPIRKQKGRWIKDWISLINPELSKPIVTDSKELFQGLEEVKQEKLTVPKLGTILLEAAIFTPYFPITEKAKKSELKYDDENQRRQIDKICSTLGFSDYLIYEAVQHFYEALKEIPSSTFWKKAMIVITSILLLAITGGAAAPFIGGAIGAAMGLTGIAAVNAGLALLGGGAIAAGGFGIAGGTAVIIGGGAVLGGGISAGVLNLFSHSNHLVLRELAKLEAVSKVFLKTLPNAREVITLVVSKENETIHSMKEEITKLKLQGDNSKDTIKELETGIKYCEKAIDRLIDFKNNQC
jgi:hypothetical protein